MESVSLGARAPLKKYRGITSHPSYFGVMTRDRIESMLKEKGGNHYLLWYTKMEGLYKMSVIEMGMISHIGIQWDEEGLYTLKGMQKKFRFISDLIAFYKKVRVLKSYGISDYDFKLTDTEECGTSEDAAELATPESHRPRSPELGSFETEALLCPSTNKEFMQVLYKKLNTTPPLRIHTAVSTKELKGISDHPSYHGAISWTEAETKLREHGGNCYLTRYTTGRKVYVLSVMSKEKGSDCIFQHLNLVITSGKTPSGTSYEIEGAGSQFPDIFKLLDFYERAPVNHQLSCIGECLSSHPDQLQAPPPPTAKYMGYPSEVQSDLEQCQLDQVDVASKQEKDIHVPILSSLTLLKWTDKEGRKQSLRLIQECSPQWETVGILVGVDEFKINNFKSSAANNMENCREVFREWIANEGHPDYPVTWEGVCELLNDVQKGELAKKLNEALKCMNVTWDTPV